MGVTVRPIAADDEAAWMPLWRDYLTFYGVDLDLTVTDATWRRLLDKESPIFGFAGCVDGEVAGFAHGVLHANTWTTEPVCYLEDLFVATEARGQGVGRALIMAFERRGRKEGWHRVYWMTHGDNLNARRLYDSVAQVTDWVRYDVPLAKQLSK